MSNLTIEVKNDAMLGRMNDKALHITLIEQQKEIERLKTLWEADKQNWSCIMYEKEKEIERLNNKVEELMTLYTTERHVKEDYKAIIKEVREYIEKNIDNEVVNNWYLTNEEAHELLEILDKERI